MVKSCDVTGWSNLTQASPVRWEKSKCDGSVYVVSGDEKNKVSDKTVSWISQHIRRLIICTCEKSLTVRGHELADCWWGSAAALHERHLRDDDVVLEHWAAAHTHSVTTSLVHVHICPTAVLTPPHVVSVVVLQWPQADRETAMTRTVCLNKRKDDYIQMSTTQIYLRHKTSHRISAANQIFLHRGIRITSCHNTKQECCKWCWSSTGCTGHRTSAQKNQS